jgi:DNA-binding transcriptional ArsR family regulator
LIRAAPAAESSEEHNAAATFRINPRYFARLTGLFLNFSWNSSSVICSKSASFGRPNNSQSETLSLPLQCRHLCGILNHMVQYSQIHFDASFGALSDATRRGVLEQLARADASITALAERFHMTLTGMKKHVGVLEKAGLVSTEKVGRVRICKLGPRTMEEEAAWIESYRRLWAARFDELDMVVEELKRKE